MYLEKEILQRASDLKANSLSSFLDIYDSCLKKHQVSPSSNDAIQLYASLINKFMTGNRTRKQDMDPNLFSFGKKKHIDTDPQQHKHEIGAKLMFQDDKETIERSKPDNSYKYLVKSKQSKRPKEENMKKRTEIEICETKANSNNQSQQIVFSQPDLDVKQQDTVSAFNRAQKLLWFECLQSHHQRIVSQSIKNLHFVSLQDYLKGQIAFKILKSLKANYRIVLKQYSGLDEVLDYFSKRRFFQKAVRYQQLVNNREILLQEDCARVEKIHKVLFIRRLESFKYKKSRRIEEIKCENECIQSIVWNTKKRALETLLLRSKSQSYLLESQTLSAKLARHSKLLVCQSLRMVLERRNQRTKVRQQWIHKNGPRKLLLIAQFAQCLINLIPDMRIKQQQTRQFTRWCQSCDVEQHRTTINLSQYTNQLMCYLKSEQSNIRSVRQLIKRNNIRLIRDKVSTNSLIQNKQKELLNARFWCYQSEFIKHLQDNAEWSLKRRALTTLRKSKSLRGFVNKLIKHTLDSSYKRRLQYQTDRYRYIKSLKSAFQCFVLGSIGQRKDRLVIARMVKLLSKTVMHKTFNLISKQSLSNRVLDLKYRQLIRIRNRRLKTSFYSSFKTKSNTDDLETKLLKKCFNAWKLKHQLRIGQLLLEKSIARDRELYMLQQIFEVLKLNKQNRMRDRQKQMEIEASYHERLKTDCLRTLIQGTIKGYKISTFVSILELTFKRRVFNQLKQRTEQGLEDQGYRRYK